MSNHEGKSVKNLIRKNLEDIGFIMAVEMFEDSDKNKLQGFINELEKIVIDNMLTMTEGNQSLSATKLGISRTALIYKAKKYGLLRIVSNKTFNSLDNPFEM